MDKLLRIGIADDFFWDIWTVYLNNDEQLITVKKDVCLHSTRGTIASSVCSNVSPSLDQSREKTYPNGNGHIEDSSSSDEEVRKSLVVEISPLVTYAGEVSVTFSYFISWIWNLAANAWLAPICKVRPIQNAANRGQKQKENLANFSLTSHCKKL